jgi:hypothetical protein
VTLSRKSPVFAKIDPVTEELERNSNGLAFKYSPQNMSNNPRRCQARRQNSYLWWTEMGSTRGKHIRGIITILKGATEAKLAHDVLRKGECDFSNKGHYQADV